MFNVQGAMFSVSLQIEKIIKFVYPPLHSVSLQASARSSYCKAVLRKKHTRGVQWFATPRWDLSRLWRGPTVFG